MEGVFIRWIGGGDGADFFDEAVEVSEGFFAVSVDVDFEVAFADFRGGVVGEGGVELGEEAAHFCNVRWL